MEQTQHRGCKEQGHEGDQRQGNEKVTPFAGRELGWGKAHRAWAIGVHGGFHWKPLGHYPERRSPD